MAEELSGNRRSCMRCTGTVRIVSSGVPEKGRRVMSGPEGFWHSICAGRLKPDYGADSGVARFRHRGGGRDDVAGWVIARASVMYCLVRSAKCIKYTFVVFFLCQFTQGDDDWLVAPGINHRSGADGDLSCSCSGGQCHVETVRDNFQAILYRDTCHVITPVKFTING